MLVAYNKQFLLLIVLASVFIVPLVAEAAVSDDDYYGPRRLVSVQNQLTNIANTPSGAFLHEIPITIPPGRNGLQPELSFTYNSQNKNKASLFGYGWDVSIHSIQRHNKTGTDKLYSNHYFLSSISGELEDISLSDGEHGTYGAKVDDGSFLKYEYATSTDAWEVTDKEGVVYTFGTATSTQQYDASDTSRVFKWLLEEVRDQNDNYISYEYYHDDGQVYPSKIKYTGNGTTDGIFEVEFLREARDDDHTSYESAFEVGTNYRIDEVQVKVDGSWVRKYELAYTTGDNTKRSLLSSITETGKDESANTITLPAHSFTYQDHNDSWTEDTAWVVPQDFDNGAVVVTDITGDNLPDIIKSKQSGPTHYKTIHINDGVDGWADETSNWTLPVVLTDGNAQHPHTFLVDVDGDGYVDILKATNATSTRAVYINDADGTGWTQDSNYDIPFDFETAAGVDHAYQLMDANGDGLIDIVHSENTSTSSVFFNDGDGTGWTEDTNWSVPISLGSSPRYDVRIFDANGDGLVDIVHSENTTTGKYDNVYINNGKDGWDNDSNYSVPVNFSNNGAQQRQIGILDANGDGLLDFVDADGNAQTRKIYLNKGDGTGWAEDTNYSVPVSVKAEEVLIIDMDGDGLIDFARSESSGGTRYDHVYENDGDEVDLLSQITTSDGAVITPDYEAVIDFRDGNGDSLSTLPFSFDAVDQIIVNDGLGNTTTESFSYEGGEYYYNSELERKFAGFHKVITTDPGSNVTKEYYHQGNASDSSNGENSDDVSKIGLKYRTEVFDDSSNKYEQLVEKWENYDLSNDRDFVKRTRLTEYSYDGDASHKDKATEWTYDNTYGNVTKETQYGEVTTTTQDGAFTDTGSDKFTTDYTYALNTTDYIVGLPKQETLKNQSASTVADTKFYYDSQSHGTVNDGNLTKREEWETASTWIDWEWTYDSTYGLVTQEKDPRNKATNYDYDSDNLYVATSTNAKSQATTYTYDYSSGKVKVTTNPNTRQFETTYDALDRPKLEKAPDLSTPSTLVTKTEYTYTDTGVPRKTQVRQHLDGTTNADTYVYKDGLGRTIQERVEAEDTNTFSVTDFVYGDNGLVEKESLPYFDTGSARTTATTNNYLYTTYTYDALDRVKTAANILGTTSYSYDDWETVVTDTESNAKDTHKDAYGNLVKVEEHNGVSTYTTNYEYNGLGKLTKVTDAASNVRNFTYDGLGNRLTAEDLHASADATFGTWTYTYDDAGNVTRIVDPKNQTIDYTYDDLNRVLTEDYTGDSGTEVSYTYDVGTNGKGHLTSVTRGGVTTAYAYNAVGDVDTETRTVSSTDYVTEYDYDRQSNITLLTYPDDAEAKYTFNTAGLAEKVERKESGGSLTDVITDLDYGPHGKIVYKDYGNNVVSYYTYDPEDLYRLRNITTIDPEDVVDESVAEVVEEPVVLAEEETVAEEEAVTEVVEEATEEVASEETTTTTPAVEETSVEEVTEVVKVAEETVVQEETATTTAAVEKPIEQPVEVTEEVVEETTITQEETANATSTQATVKEEVVAEETVALEGETAAVSDQSEEGTQVTEEAKTKEVKKEKIAKDIRALIKDKSANERATLKGRELAKLEFVDDVQRSRYKIKITKVEPIEGGVQVFARAWHNGEQIGFGDDGTVDIERFRIINPPILVDDPRGDVVLTKNDPDTGEEVERRLREDPEEALLQALEDIIRVKQLKFGSQNIEQGKVGNTTSTFYPDADPETDTVDGVIGRNNRNETWSAIHDASAGTDVNDSSGSAVGVYIRAHWASTNKWKDLERSIFTFDTSSIADTDVLDSATISFYGDGGYNDLTNDAAANVYSANPASDDELVTDDYDTLGTTEFSTSIEFTDFSDNSYNDFLLNSSGEAEIDFTGITRFGLRESEYDATDTEPTWQADKQNRIALHFADYSGTTRDPKLVVEHSMGNVAPNAPTALETERTTNPTSVGDGTPEFSAVYDDDNTEDTATDYQIEVIADGGSWASPLWDSTKTALGTAVNEGSRSEEISYGGTALAQNGAKYYWRIKFWDDNGNEGTWSNGSDHFTMAGTPTAPTNLYSGCVTAQSGNTNPTGLKCGTPVFSAVFDDSGTSFTGKKYRIQVGTASDFQSGISWDSGSSGTDMSDVADGSRSADLVYGGDPLNYDDTTYYWRIKFWNDGSVEGGWSTATSTFSTYDSEIFQDVHYTYDSVGNITKIVDSSDTNSGKTVDYTYDDLYRLTAASSTDAVYGTDYSRTYTYDSIGNFTNKSDIGTYSYSGTGKANPHAATTVGSDTYTYDDNGNLTGDGTRTYTWNYDNTAATVVKSGTTYTHTYDHDGQRVSTADGSTTTTFANKYYNTDGTNTTKHIYAGDELVATIEDDGTTVDVWYVHPDHLGGTSVLTNASSTEAQAIDYFPFGEIRVNDQTDSVDEQRKFTGHEYDSGAEIHYANARYYSQNAGRFTSQDPVAAHALERVLHDPQQLNTYNYVANNPVNATDPTGESLVKLAKALGNIAARSYKTYKSTGKLDIKGSFRQEAANFADNVSTLADGQLTPDDAFAVIDLATGFGGLAKNAVRKINVSPYDLHATEIPDRGKVNQIENSIQKHGFFSNKPVKYHEVDGTKYIVDGHHRTQAAKNLNLESIPAKPASTQVFKNQGGTSRDFVNKVKGTHGD